MKQIFEVGTVQYFTYTIPMLFKKKVENHWVFRNVKYIYADNEEEAKKKYKEWFYRGYTEIIKGWSNWHLWSDGVGVMMHENLIDITETKIITFDSRYININFKELQENMQAEDFKEWWFDNGRCNRIPE